MQMWQFIFVFIHTLDDSPRRYGVCRVSAQGFLLLPCTFHLSLSSYFDVAQARMYFASAFLKAKNMFLVY